SAIEPSPTPEPAGKIEKAEAPEESNGTQNGTKPAERGPLGESDRLPGTESPAVSSGAPAERQPGERDREPGKKLRLEAESGPGDHAEPGQQRPRRNGQRSPGGSESEPGSRDPIDERGTDTLTSVPGKTSTRAIENDENHIIHPDDVIAVRSEA